MPRPNLIDIAVDVVACAKLDFEVDIRGNGCNASENEAFALEVFDFFGYTREMWEERVAKRVDELEEDYG